MTRSREKFTFTSNRHTHPVGLSERVVSSLYMSLPTQHRISTRLVASIPGIKRFQTYPLDCTATGIGMKANFLKVKVHPIICHEGTEGELIYNFTSSLTSALAGVGWLTPRPGRFTRGNDPVSIVQGAGWAPVPVWTGG